MENGTENKIEHDYCCHKSKTEEDSGRPLEKNRTIGNSLLVSAFIIAAALLYTEGTPAGQSRQNNSASPVLKNIQVLRPSGGVTYKETVLPVRWENLGAKMVSVGIIDRQKIETLYASRAGLGEEEKSLLEDYQNKSMKITSKNSAFILNLFWALGLGTKNDILDKGLMFTYGNGSVGNFASTGGWTLSAGNAIDHFSRHPLIALTPAQQLLVERVSKNIYRPCCDNSTYFPDCNHGMAMLGFLELMASQGVGEDEMYKAALKINEYWFPDNYVVIAQYFENRGVKWENVDPREVLGKEFSSASGYRKILQEVGSEPRQDAGTNCGVDSGSPAIAPEPRQSGGCGV